MNDIYCYDWGEEWTEAVEYIIITIKNYYYCQTKYGGYLYCRDFAFIAVDGPLV